jgi:DNA-binding transcriptional MerR regulator
MDRSSDLHRTAASTARRLGLTVRALRLYERHGLVQPGRTAAGWRVYGPAEIARLHQVIALKRLGLTLAQIALLMKGRGVDLAHVLALQEQELLQRKQQIDRALALVRRARDEIAQGNTLPIDDLVELTKETSMTGFEPSPEFQALVAKHTNLQRVKAIHPEWTAEDQVRVNAQWAKLIAEAQRLKDDDPSSPAALDLARRWQALVNEFTRHDPELKASLKAIYWEGYANPAMTRHMPVSPEIMRFINEACTRLSE